MGVISEPPPTPVSPTTRPTKNPAKTNAKSSMSILVEGWSLRVFAYIANYIFLISLYVFKIKTGARVVWRGFEAVRAVGEIGEVGTAGECLM